MPEVQESKPEAKGLKSTLNLPQTTFPMKANLPQNEPVRLAAWTEAGLYEQIRAARKGSPKYILHDGPPYANGAIHLGHALNKCIKDFVVKTKTMAGFDSPYVPGWDCHGLPIEIKVDEQLGRKKLEMEPIAVRRACREYAQKYVDLQRSQFERLGVFGRWNNPYLTMSFGYEASILETFYEFFEKDFRLQGPQAGLLVHPRPHRPRRSRSRVRAARISQRLRPLRPHQRRRHHPPFPRQSSGT